MVQTIEALKKKGLWFVCADMDGEPMTRLNLTGPIGMIVGAEGSGVSRLVKEHCDTIASIPLRGEINSLNASVAAGVLAKAMDQLHDALGRAGGHIYPACDLVATVVGIELDLMQHGNLPRLTDRMLQLLQAPHRRNHRPPRTDCFAPQAENAGNFPVDTICIAAISFWTRRLSCQLSWTPYR